MQARNENSSSPDVQQELEMVAERMENLAGLSGRLSSDVVNLVSQEARLTTLCWLEYLGLIVGLILFIVLLWLTVLTSMMVYVGVVWSWPIAILAYCVVNIAAIVLLRRRLQLLRSLAGFARTKACFEQRVPYDFSKEEGIEKADHHFIAVVEDVRLLKKEKDALCKQAKQLGSTPEAHIAAYISGLVGGAAKDKKAAYHSLLRLIV